METLRRGLSPAGDFSIDLSRPALLVDYLSRPAAAAAGK